MVYLSSDEVATKRKLIGSMFFLPILLATLMFIVINRAPAHFLETGIWITKTAIIPAILLILAALLHFIKR